MSPDARPFAVVFRDLGDLYVEVHGHRRTAGGGRPTALLSALLVHANHRVSLDALGEAVWPDGSRRATSTLESHLWRLRQVLEPDRVAGQASTLLRTEPGGYRLVVGSEQVDSLRFAELSGASRTALEAGRPDEAAELCGRARELWRGRPFAAVADQPWASPVVARLEELHSQLLERQIEALLALGRPDAALVELETALAARPLREHLWALRVVASYRVGRVEDALAAFTRARTLLRDELGTEPGDELRAAHRRVLAADPALDGPRPAAATTEVRELPHLPRWTTRLVGRDRELEQLTSLVGRSSPVTVHGPAGVGKTRLAIEAAHQLADTYPDGVWFVDLTAARDGDQVLDAVTTELSLAAPAAGSPRDVVLAFLRDRHGLLLLDDCEHVLADVASLVGPLCHIAPDLRTIVTSRERLDLADETLVELQPLVITDDDHVDGPALDLFLDRWEAATGPTDPDDLEDVRRVCRAVEGVPLALELAAARAGAFTLAEIAQQTDQDPGTLSALGRHRDGARPTVYAAVERSHRLLDDDARLLHRRLAVLPGLFTAAAAAAVAGIPPVVAADLLTDLTHRSMLVARGPAGPGRPSRFSQLTIVRAHAARALHDAHETTAAQDRRDIWIERLVAERPRLGTPEDLARSRALADDAAALRSTLQHTLIEDPSPRGAQIVADLGALFWFQHDATLEGARWIEIAHTSVATVPGDVPGVAALRVAIGAATALAFARRLDLAAPLCDQALRDLDVARLDPAQELLTGDALVVLSTSLGSAGEPERAAAALAAAADIAWRTADPTLTLVHRVRTRMAELGRGDPGDVLASLADSYREASAVDNWFGAWIASATAHMAALATGDATAALEWSDACLAVVDRTGRQQAPLQLELRANTLALLGRHEEALRVYGAARAQIDRAGLPWPTAAGTETLLERTRGAVPSDTANRIANGAARLTVTDLRTPVPAER